MIEKMKILGCDTQTGTIKDLASKVNEIIDFLNHPELTENARKAGWEASGNPTPLGPNSFKSLCAECVKMNEDLIEFKNEISKF